MATLFFSYSHKDEDLRNELEVHLAMLKRDKLIDTWHDRRILAGDDLDTSISAKLESADVILALISPDFLASNYCYDVEMTRALERHRLGECRVIAVILRPCDWKSTPFARVLVTPTDGKPVKKWPDRDEALLDVVQQIRKALPQKSESAAINVSQATSTFKRTGSSRSSNLRVHKEFTEADKHRFLDETFEFLALFFEGSLEELQQRNPGIEARFKRIDSQAFGAIIYRQGKVVSQCGIRNGGFHGFGDGISYTNDVTAPTNSQNDYLSVQEGDQALYLGPGMGMGRRFGQRDGESHLTSEGAAEYFWGLLIEPLQQDSRR